MSDELPGVSMYCRVNDEESATVPRDMPLIISVSMVNDVAASAASYNAPLEDEIQRLEDRLEAGHMEQEDFDAAVEELRRDLVKVKVYRIGGPGGWPHFIKLQSLTGEEWGDVDWPLWLLLHHPEVEVAEINASTTCYVELGFDSDDPKRPEGELQIRAVAKLFGDETIESDSATVNFLAESLPEAEREKEEVLVEKGEYALKRGLHEEALKYAQGALKAFPSSISALGLLAEIEESRGNLRGALSAYERAFEEFGKQSKMRDPPRYFIKKIRLLRARLESEQA
jgi:tetratricopeptide (TPR) repeat protein